MARKAKGQPTIDKNLKNSGTIVEADFKYMLQNPNGDVGFNPEHNRMVVEETIRKTKAKERELKKQYMNQVEERVDAGVAFLRSLERRKINPATDNIHDIAMKYFGRKELARLRGEEIKARLMAQMGIMGDLIN